ncbi:putative F-box domain-containing protein [Helianthus anomalus]
MSTMLGGKLMVFGGGRRVKREWQDIQTELLMKIVSLLDDRTVIVASGVCSGWRNAICSELTHLSLSCYLFYIFLSPLVCSFSSFTLLVSFLYLSLICLCGFCICCSRFEIFFFN